MDINGIIPVYNGEKHNKNCLNSLKEQDYSGGKVIIYIVDDNSSDATVQIAREAGCKILINGARHIERG